MTTTPILMRPLNIGAIPQIIKEQKQSSPQSKESKETKILTSRIREIQKKEMSSTKRMKKPKSDSLFSHGEIEKREDHLYLIPSLDREVKLTEEELDNRKKNFMSAYGKLTAGQSNLFQLKKTEQQILGRCTITSATSPELHENLQTICNEVGYPITKNRNIFLNSTFLLKLRLYIAFKKKDPFDILENEAINIKLDPVKFAKCSFSSENNILRISNIRNRCMERSENPPKTPSIFIPPPIIHTKNDYVTSKSFDMARLPDSPKSLDSQRSLDSSLDSPKSVDSPKRLESPTKIKGITVLTAAADIIYSDRMTIEQRIKLKTIDTTTFMKVSILLLDEKITPNGYVSLPNDTFLCVDNLPGVKMKHTCALNKTSLNYRIKNFYHLKHKSYYVYNSKCKLKTY
jgi:hypothetical protein